MSPADVQIVVEPFDGPSGRKLVAALDADLDERYAADDDAEGEPDYAFLNILDSTVAPPLGAFLVAYLDGEPAGCGAIRPHHLDPTAAEVKRMYVVPSVRGHGIARALLAALESDAGRLGYVRVVLETGIRQQEAIALYESEGYTRIANFGAYRDSALSRCYEKRLGG